MRFPITRVAMGILILALSLSAAATAAAQEMAATPTGAKTAWIRTASPFRLLD